MSMCTRYGEMLIQWSFETFHAPLLAVLLPDSAFGPEIWANATEEEKLRLGKCGQNVFKFLKYFGDPRFKYNGEHIISVKDEFFPEFQAWCKNKGFDCEKPEVAFYSMMCWETQFLTIDDLDNIKEIVWKEKE